MDAYERRALIERLERETAETLAEMAERRARREMDEACEPRAPEQRIEHPNPRSPVMTPEASAAWNKWAKGVAWQVIEKFADGVAETLATVRRELRQEIAALRSEIKEQRAENIRLREQLSELRGEMRGRQASAALPAIPKPLKGVQAA